jgi:hypothetical protein
MLPTGMTLTTIFADAPDVVNAFGALLVLVVGLGFGMYAVKRIPSWIKRAMR